MVDTVALVTGASSGIGAATVRALAAQGASVAAVARRADRLADLAAEHEGDVLAIPADITDEAAARAAVQRTIDHFGHLDVLVNNAGIMLLGPFTTNPASDWRRMLELNVVALMTLTHEALPHLKASAAGPRGIADIINVGSIAGRTTRPNFAVYNASKWAVTAFSEALRQELAADGVRVGIVQPGAVDTELVGHVDPDVRAAMAAGSFAAVERASADDVAATIAGLAGQQPGFALSEVVVRAARQVF